MRRLILALLLLALAAPAMAQDQRPQVLADGLASQYAAALLRERRLADDRQLSLIQAAETRMRDARRISATARGQRDTATQALDAARAEYASLVSAAVDRQALLRVEVEAFRAELTGTIQQATPELLAAYQAFADSDRAAAWPQLEALLNARAAARRAAARAIAAREIAQLAQLRHIMVVNGEAPLASERPLWEQAAVLNPDDNEVHLNIARLSRLMGDHARARTAAAEAIRTAHGDIEVSIANVELADNAHASGDAASAVQHYQTALEIERRLSEQYPNRLYPVSILLERLAAAQIDQRNWDGALGSYTESIRLIRIFVRAAPGDPLYLVSLATQLHKQSDVYARLERMPEARAAIDESLSIMRPLVQQDPNNVELRNDLGIGLEGLADLQVRDGQLTEALANHRESLALLNDIIVRDPGNAFVRLNISVATRKIGEILAAQGDVEGASRNFNDSLAIIDQLIAADPSNGELFIGKTAILNALGDLQRDHGQTAEAAATYAEMLETATALLERQPSTQRIQRNVGFAIERLVALQPQGARLADVRVLLARRQAQGIATDSDRRLLTRLQHTNRLGGAWRGIHVDGRRASQIEVDIVAADATALRATAAYPGYNCSVAWEASFSEEGQWRIRETVTENRELCVDADVVVILVPDGALYVEWLQGERTTGLALLHAVE